jgi:hypothetical protein
MVFASVGHFALDRDDPQATPHSGKAMIVFACLFILGFASTWGPIIWSVIFCLLIPKLKGGGGGEPISRARSSRPLNLHK